MSTYAHVHICMYACVCSSWANTRYVNNSVKWNTTSGIYVCMHIFIVVGILYMHTYLRYKYVNAYMQPHICTGPQE